MATQSAARDAFEANRADIDRLLEIHSDLAGDTPGRKHGVAVLNKSGVVLTCAVWEAYCEDLAAEAVKHLADNAASPDDLPKQLRKNLATELKAQRNELAVWALADDGWRAYLKTRLEDITEARNRKLNTPKSVNIRQLFVDAAGIADVTRCWRWRHMSAQSASKKLDSFVALRGSIAHRAAASHSVKKSHVRNFVDLTERLVVKTDAYVNTEVESACGTPIFVAEP